MGQRWYRLRSDPRTLRIRAGAGFWHVVADAPALAYRPGMLGVLSMVLSSAAMAALGYLVWVLVRRQDDAPGDPGAPKP